VSGAPAWRVGLTGGIASGKSTVAALFAALGVPVIDLDEIAREVVAPGTALLAQVLDHFGPAVRAADGGLNRRALRDIVFADAVKRRELEALMHPAMRARAAQRSLQAGGPYQIIVDPLIAETRSAGRYDRVLLVDCDEALQRTRLAQRDGSSESQVAAALGAQAARAARRALATDVLENSGDVAALRQQVRSLHERYLALAGAAGLAR
jgi:dephospho-CoA kinase